MVSIYILLLLLLPSSWLLPYIPAEKTRPSAGTATYIPYNVIRFVRVKFRGTAMKVRDNVITTQNVIVVRHRERMQRGEGESSVKLGRVRYNFSGTRPSTVFFFASK